MQFPIIAPAPLVAAHAETFRDLFENRYQFRRFENYLTGLLVLPNKSMANIARCTVESLDKTNLSRYFSTDRWEQKQRAFQVEVTTTPGLFDILLARRNHQPRSLALMFGHKPQGVVDH